MKKFFRVVNEFGKVVRTIASNNSGKFRAIYKTKKGNRLVIAISEDVNPTKDSIFIIKTCVRLKSGRVKIVIKEVFGEELTFYEANLSIYIGLAI